MSERTFSLDVVSVETPCHEEWDAMAGDEQRRFCDSCEKHVHNLSKMTRAQAEVFVAANPSGVCIRMHKDADGRVITADSPPNRQRRRTAAKGLLAWLGVLAGAASAVLIWFGISQRPTPPTCTMGIESPLPPPKNQPTPTPPPIPVPIQPALMGDICIAPELEPEPPKPDLPPEVVEMIEQIQSELQEHPLPKMEVLLGRIVTPPRPRSLEELQEQLKQSW